MHYTTHRHGKTQLQNHFLFYDEARNMANMYELAGYTFPGPKYPPCPEEYKDKWGRLLPRIKARYDGPGPNMCKFIRMMDDFFSHQEIENMRQAHHIKFLESQCVMLRREVASCRALFKSPKAIRALKRADLMTMYHELFKETWGQRDWQKRNWARDKQSARCPLCQAKWEVTLSGKLFWNFLWLYPSQNFQISKGRF